MTAKQTILDILESRYNHSDSQQLPLDENIAGRLVGGMFMRGARAVGKAVAQAGEQAVKPVVDVAPAVAKKFEIPVHHPLAIYKGAAVPSVRPTGAGEIVVKPATVARIARQETKPATALVTGETKTTALSTEVKPSAKTSKEIVPAKATAIETQAKPATETKTMVSKETKTITDPKTGKELATKGATEVEPAVVKKAETETAKQIENKTIKKVEAKTSKEIGKGKGTGGTGMKPKIPSIPIQLPFASGSPEGGSALYDPRGQISPIDLGLGVEAIGQFARRQILR